MRENITIELIEPLRAPEGPVTRIVLRAPGFSDYRIVAEPYTVADTEDGNRFAVENFENIFRYIERCLVEPKDPATLQQLDAVVAREVKNEFLRFFHPREPEDETSATSPTK